MFEHADSKSKYIKTAEWWMEMLIRLNPKFLGYEDSNVYYVEHSQPFYSNNCIWFYAVTKTKM